MNADRDKSEQPCTGTRCDAQTHPAGDDVRVHNDDRTSVDDAIQQWEAKGPTSLTTALMADALYRARAELVELADLRHALSWADLAHAYAAASDKPQETP